MNDRGVNHGAWLPKAGSGRDPRGRIGEAPAARACLVAVALLVGACPRGAERRQAVAPIAKAGSDVATPQHPLVEVRGALGEASGIVVLGAGKFLVVDDENGVQLVDTAVGPIPSVRLILRRADLEGIAAIGEGRFLVVAEGSGTLTGFTIDGEAKDVGTLAHPPSDKPKKNKGWEGITLLPSPISFDHRDHLIAVHEGHPKAIVLFAWPSLAAERTFILDGALEEKLADLSDVTVDGRSGELLLLSDESRCYARAVVSATEVLMRGDCTPLAVSVDEKPEGIALDDVGYVWIATDGASRLFRLSP